MSIEGSGALTFTTQSLTGSWNNGLTQTSDPTLGTVIGLQDDIVPSVDAAFDLGTKAKRMRTIHVTQVNNDSSGETLNVGNYTSDVGTTNLFGTVRGKDGLWSINQSGGQTNFGSTQDLALAATGNLSINSPATKSIIMNTDTVQMNLGQKLLINAATSVGIRGTTAGSPTVFSVGQTGAATTTMFLGGVGPNATTSLSLGQGNIGNVTTTYMNGTFTMTNDQGLYPSTFTNNATEGLLQSSTTGITERAPFSRISGPSGDWANFLVGDLGASKSSVVTLGCQGTGATNTILLGGGNTSSINSTTIFGGLYLKDNTGNNVSTFSSDGTGVVIAPAAGKTVAIGSTSGVGIVNLATGSGSSTQDIFMFGFGQTGVQTLTIGWGTNPASRIQCNNLLVRSPEYKESTNPNITLAATYEAVPFNTVVGTNSLVSFSYNAGTYFYTNISGRALVVQTSFQATWSGTPTTNRSIYIFRNTGGSGPAGFLGSANWASGDIITRSCAATFRVLNGQAFQFGVQSTTTGETITELQCTITVL